MELSVVEEEGVTIVRLEGRMDIKGAEKIDMKFAGIAGVRAKVAADLSGVDYIASIGIRTDHSDERGAGLYGLSGLSGDVFEESSGALL